MEADVEKRLCPLPTGRAHRPSQRLIPDQSKDGIRERAHIPWRDQEPGTAIGPEDHGYPTGVGCYHGPTHRHGFEDDTTERLGSD